MKQALEKIELAAKEQLAKVADSAELEALRVRFLGKKGELTAILKGIGAFRRGKTCYRSACKQGPRRYRGSRRKPRRRA